MADFKDKKTAKKYFNKLLTKMWFEMTKERNFNFFFWKINKIFKKNKEEKRKIWSQNKNEGQQENVENARNKNYLNWVFIKFSL